MSSNRRDFMKRMAAMIAAAEVGFDTVGVGSLAGQPTPIDGPASPGKRFPDDAVIGIQMSPHSMVDEGIEATLDLIRTTAEVNTVIPYSHAFHTRTLGKPVRDLAEHGVPLRDFRGRVPAVWVRHTTASFPTPHCGCGKPTRRWSFPTGTSSRRPWRPPGSGG